MDAASLALVAGGGLGVGVGVIHGAMMERFIVRPVGVAVAGGRMAAGTRRLITPLLHFSTFGWVVAGLALIAAGAVLGREARLAVGLLTGAGYAYAAVANVAATRGRHPGGWLMALVVALIAIGLWPDLTT